MGFLLTSPTRPTWGLTPTPDPEPAKSILARVSKTLDFLWFILRADFLSRPWLANFKNAAITISGADTTGTWTFTDQLGKARAETDTDYMLVVTPVSSTGAPAAGSNRVLSYTKTKTSVTISIEVAPGGATSVTFDLALLRQS